ncbi:MAG: helix-turn-helix transcriptional regulator [Rhodospirillales bacterium]|nr:helix-turn-helix transcriptional regulator [Alphaproteobacteria bacterium]MCB9987444.1 helix-turn-helix transcriptional regulator [Rhodospirillales bacterium]USO07576.1 MAG: helix-turn-helix transcriptional regulator [Rhodospirillales bacterium]
MRKTKESAGTRDKVFGSRLRQRRTFLGYSQQTLGEAVGMTFQQIQKYEHGTNKISAARLVDFSRVLNVPISYFYAGLGDIGEKTPRALAVSDVSQASLDDDPILKKESTQLLKYYYKIKDEALRKSVQKLVRQMAEQSTSAKK